MWRLRRRNIFFNTAQKAVNFTWYDFFIALIFYSETIYIYIYVIFGLCTHFCICSGMFYHGIVLIMQAITGDSVFLKFEKARCALVESLRRVDDIVPQSIGCQVIIM